MSPSSGPQHWPSGIMVNWYITSVGGKISKSKGGAQPIPDAAERFGVDAMRLFYAHIASLFVDVAWEDEKAETYRDRLERIWSQVSELEAVTEDAPSDIDGWLEARMQLPCRGAPRAHGGLRPQVLLQ